MTIHIYKEKGHKNLVFVMDFELIEELNPVWLYLKTKTGVIVSEYDDAVVFSNHMSLMISLLLIISLSRRIRGLMNFLKCLRQMKVWMLFISRESKEYVFFLPLSSPSPPTPAGYTVTVAAVATADLSTAQIQ